MIAEINFIATLLEVGILVRASQNDVAAGIESGKAWSVPAGAAGIGGRRIRLRTILVQFVGGPPGTDAQTR
jgi:hypothetical protein